MPARNVVKQYQEKGYYHLYNRGVEKRDIFTDKQDAAVFLGYLKDYLSPKDIEGLMKTIINLTSSSHDKLDAARLLRMNNFADEIELLAYCLMPNHFHLLVRQNEARGIEKFMKSLLTRYVQYFNRRQNSRVGGLFQSTYKAVLVQTEEQLLWLTRYIHRNPASKGLSLKDPPLPSSYRNYLGLVKQEWVRPKEILNYFTKSGLLSYGAFVEDDAYDAKTEELIKDIILEG